VDFQGAHPQISIQAGSLQKDGVGYVYKVTTNQFEELDELQWITYEVVTPLESEVIQAQDFLRWIEYT
jgi:hypothetical protein